MNKFKKFEIKMLDSVYRENITFVQQNKRKRYLVKPLTEVEYKRVLGFGFSPQHLYVFHDDLDLLQINNYTLWEDKIVKLIGYKQENRMVTIEFLTGAKIEVHEVNLVYGHVIATTDKALSLRCNCGHLKKVNTGLCLHCAKFGVTEIVPLLPFDYEKHFINQSNARNIPEHINLEVEQMVFVAKEHFLTGSDFEKQCMNNPFDLPILTANKEVIVQY